jgi:hypothetical protein
MPHARLKRLRRLGGLGGFLLPGIAEILEASIAIEVLFFTVWFLDAHGVLVCVVDGDNCQSWGWQSY